MLILPIFFNGLERSAQARLVKFAQKYSLLTLSQLDFSIH